MKDGLFITLLGFLLGWFIMDIHHHLTSPSNSTDYTPKEIPKEWASCEAQLIDVEHELYRILEIVEKPLGYKYKKRESK